MNFLDLAKKRYSVRKYTEQKVEQDKLDKILTAAHVAPTAANIQPVHLIVVREGRAYPRFPKPQTSITHL